MAVPLCGGFLRLGALIVGLSRDIEGLGFQDEGSGLPKIGGYHFEALIGMIMKYWGLYWDFLI